MVPGKIDRLAELTTRFFFAHEVTFTTGRFRPDQEWRKTAIFLLVLNLGQVGT
jgi:hypothetical protein